MAGIDWLILSLYIVFVVGIGFALRSSMKTSTDFFLAGRAIPAWVCGLAFISANLGAQEVIGMGASGAKYGIATSHFYWVGAIPAMVFVGIFMMPFYYGSRARSVPEYLRLHFDVRDRQACSDLACPGWPISAVWNQQLSNIRFCDPDFRGDCARVHLSWRPIERHL